jgi:hypothetical protein
MAPGVSAPCRARSRPDALVEPPTGLRRLQENVPATSAHNTPEAGSTESWTQAAAPHRMSAARGLAPTPPRNRNGQGPPPPSRHIDRVSRRRLRLRGFPAHQSRRRRANARGEHLTRAWTARVASERVGYPPPPPLPPASRSRGLIEIGLRTRPFGRTIVDAHAELRRSSWAATSDIQQITFGGEPTSMLHW